VEAAAEEVAAVEAAAVGLLRRRGSGPLARRPSRLRLLRPSPPIRDTRSKCATDGRAYSPRSWLLQICATAHAGREQRRAGDGNDRIQKP
jgi:hypothetical protein